MCIWLTKEGLEKHNECTGQVKAYIYMCVCVRAHRYGCACQREVDPAVVGTLSSFPHLCSLLLY